MICMGYKSRILHAPIQWVYFLSILPGQEESPYMQELFWAIAAKMNADHGYIFLCLTRLIIL